MVRQFRSEIPLIPSSLNVKIFGMGKFLKFCFAIFLLYINKLLCFPNARCFLGFSTLMLSLLLCCYLLMVLLVFFCFGIRGKLLDALETSGFCLN